ncbi:MAG: Ribonuclease Z [Anaerolineales bacterium]|nr:Ribonuclease Z [Anaerolineales bacterium]
MTSRLIVLGAGAARVSATTDNTYLVFDDGAAPLLIDCAGSPAHKLYRAGIDPCDLAGVLLTHAHPDHIYGLPALVQHLAQVNYASTLPLYGLGETLHAGQQLLDTLDVNKDFLDYRPFSSQERQRIATRSGYAAYVSPTRHGKPSVGVRIEAGGRVLVYSGDTEPCPALNRLAEGGDILLHECTVNEPAKGHSTPEQVAETAATAAAGRLGLLHYYPWLIDRFDEVQSRIAKIYSGRVTLAREGDEYALG